VSALRTALSLIGGGGAAVGWLAALVVLSRPAPPDEDVTTAAVVAFDAKPPPPPPKKDRPKPQRRKPPRSDAPPAPALASSLSGLSFGLPTLEGVGLGSDLIGDVGDVVMTEDAVDGRPEPISRTAAAYPSRARAKNVEGEVVLRLRVLPDGRVEDVKVVEARPEGWDFEAAAVAAVRGWRFSPATYEGRPVAVVVTQTVRFALQ
jgi:protein TonB